VGKDTHEWERAGGHRTAVRSGHPFLVAVTIVLFLGVAQACGDAGSDPSLAPAPAGPADGGSLPDAATTPDHDSGSNRDSGGGDASSSVDAEAGAPPASPSCTALAATCGKGQNESCCTSALVPGGAYGRSNLPEYPTTVSTMWMDKFEVTVGRFRAFVSGYPGNLPAAGAGANPKVANSGWDPAWNDKLPADAAALVAQLSCAGTGSNAWTDAPGANEAKAMSCATWYEMFAFCAWDGRRLPTEAEWNYAAAGGSEQRLYPWGTGAIDHAHAVYAPETAAAVVGSRSPAGDGRWGHADLAGNVMEWNLDFYAYPYPGVEVPCADCAVLDPSPYRSVRGGGFGGQPDTLLAYMRYEWGPGGRIGNLGARCVASP
jgi:formylglycine-generating enzyme